MKEPIDIEKIYNTYVDDLYSYATYLGFDSDLVMDAIHDVFVNLFSSERPISEIQNPKFYLIRSVRNRLINASKSKQKNVELSQIENTKKDALDIENKMIDEENALLIKEKINRMLATLTKRQQEIIYLRYVQEYDYNRIAQIMNITPGACRKLVHKAIQRLKETYLILPLLLSLI